MPMAVEITMLNSMGGADFGASLKQQRAWGVRVLDLKDCILGKSLLDLTDEEGRQAAGMIAAAGMRTYCFSSSLFYEDVEMGREAFAGKLAGKVERAIKLAGILRPEVVRLLATRSSKRGEFADGAAYLRDKHPWVIELYQRAIDQLAGAGLAVTIENECDECVLAHPEEVVGFFKLIGRAGKVHFTWDVQNFWQMGTFPSLAAYETMKPLIGYYHVKGGMTEDGKAGGKLVWRSTLADASWPVEAITRRVLADGISKVICLNPPHGKGKPGYDDKDITGRDVAYLRKLIG
jgi:sugar phosphate isomerase/epimerase